MFYGKIRSDYRTMENIEKYADMSTASDYSEQVAPGIMHSTSHKFWRWLMTGGAVRDDKSNVVSSSISGYNGTARNHVRRDLITVTYDNAVLRGNNGNRFLANAFVRILIPDFSQTLPVNYVSATHRLC